MKMLRSERDRDRMQLAGLQATLTAVAGSSGSVGRAHSTKCDALTNTNCSKIDSCLMTTSSRIVVASRVLLLRKDSTLVLFFKCSKRFPADIGVRGAELLKRLLDAGVCLLGSHHEVEGKTRRLRQGAEHRKTPHWVLLCVRPCKQRKKGVKRAGWGDCRESGVCVYRARGRWTRGVR